MLHEPFNTVRRPLLPGSIGILCLALAACTEGSAPKASARPVDALVKDGRLYETEMNLVTDSNIADRLDAVRSADIERLSLRHRVVLQNDVWGLVQRLEALPATPRTRRLAQQGRALIARLALTIPDDGPLDGLRSSPAHPVLRGLDEHSTEHVSLMHERMYGLRRVFRLFIGPEKRALVSQLVALDRRGQPRLTRVIGEIEMLELAAVGADGPIPTSARVFHLDRTTAELVEVEKVDRIPDRGANRFLFEIEPAVSLADFPCGQCHEDGRMMSLPVREAPDRRLHRLLDEIKIEEENARDRS